VKALEKGIGMDLIQELRRRESFLTTKEVMELLQLRRNTVCDWANAGRIPAVRTASGYRFDPRVLADWLVARSTNPGRRAA
jgi:excisionase family DNA binding protein